MLGFSRYGKEVYRYVEPRGGRLYRGRMPCSSRMRFSRKTREEALKNIREAIEAIIEVRRAQNLPIPSPDIVEISVAA